MYAVNLYDLMVLQKNDPIGALLFPPDCLTHEVIVADRGRVFGDAIILDFDDGRAEAVVALMRMKYKKYEIKLYRSTTGNGAWKRV